ncbi:MAG TPA: glycosyltransferase family 2 protein [Campylobacterales bacterium]|nr:glycosyltransferase family 2 protein [Campylobacterales bacterium]HHD80643.1 glycosyltransferase family 2 protein [Campylobacterales bacterium]
MFFSVVVPLYNKEKYIKRTLDSILNQTFSDFEIIIVNDGSTDKSCEVIESIKDDRIHLIHKENGGVSSARNRGIKEAKGEFIAFLDADDEWFANKLQKQYVLHKKNPKLVWSCSGYMLVSKKRKDKEIVFSKSKILPDAIEAIVNGLKIFTSTVVIKKEVFKNPRLLFNEKAITSEDREVWYKLACIYPSVGYIQNILSIYNREVNDSLTHTILQNKTFYFLTIKKRIDYELNNISNNRREKFIKYLDEFNRRVIILLWAKTKSFGDDISYFEPYIDNKLITRLVSWQKLPINIKKVIVKSREFLV